MDWSAHESAGFEVGAFPFPEGVGVFGAGFFGGASDADDGASLAGVGAPPSDPDPELSEPVVDAAEESPAAALAGTFFRLSFL